MGIRLLSAMDKMITELKDSSEMDAQQKRNWTQPFTAKQLVLVSSVAGSVGDSVGTG